jgi:predicted GIY-YIG superfamily endonuclease
MHSYVYRYFDGGGNLLYVGMTSNAAQRARTHWKQSDWVSWVEDVAYKRTRNRAEAYKLESKIHREEEPVFIFTGGYAEFIKEQDAKARINHVTGACKLPGGLCHLATWTRLAKEHFAEAA